MAQENLWLVFDLGTGGVKAALMTDAGKIVASSAIDYPTHIAPGGIEEQQADDWWQASIRASASFAKQLARVNAVALTGQMQDLILISQGGAPLSSVILYSDTRAQREAAEIIEFVGLDQLRSLIGCGEGADGLLAKLVWLTRNHPNLLKQAKTLLFGAADYLGFKLTGTATTDSTTASATGLLQIQDRRWLDTGLLRQLNLDGVTAQLPLLVTGGAMIGRLAPGAAKAFGLTAGIPVYHAPGDAGATTIGVGSGEIGQIYGYVGTSGWLGFTSDQRGSAEQGVMTLAHTRPDQFIQVAPLATAGGNLEWVRDLFGRDDYDSAIAAALHRPLTDLIYLPYLSGERSPFTDPLARAAFIGMNPNTEHADLYRAVLEGVVFAYRHAFEALAPHTPDTLILTGGGTRSEAWCQMFADVFGLPMTLTADPESVALRGAVLSARVARGAFENYRPDGYFPIKTTLHPDQSLTPLYDRKYHIFRAAYPALKPIFEMAGQ